MLKVVPHQSVWSEHFDAVAAVLRRVFGTSALAVSHVGSTSITGLAAKPIIDVQVSVQQLEVMDGIGELPDNYRVVPENDRDIPPLGYPESDQQWRKRFIRVDQRNERFAHIHVRVAGCANERIALLFRDFLREHPLHREAYERLKLQLADVVGHLATQGGSGVYVELKDPLIAVILLAAEEWAIASNWSVAQAR